MWGDPHKAASLLYNNDNTSRCASSLLQVTGPAHIPLTDSRWSELFLQYETLVHLDRGSTDPTNHPTNTNGAVSRACANMARHAATSSNLAAMSLHVAAMLAELERSCGACVVETGWESEDVEGQQSKQSKQSNQSMEMSMRIAMVGKARATCGALNLLRILCHEVIATCCCCSSSSSTLDPNPHVNGNESNGILREVFTYKSRRRNKKREHDKDASKELLSALLSFISVIGGGNHHSTVSSSMSSPPPSTQTTSSKAKTIVHLVHTIPELYDAAVLSLSLLLVLFSTQLYLPMQSTFQWTKPTAPVSPTDHLHRATTNFMGHNFFLDQVMIAAHYRRQQHRQNRFPPHPQSQTNHTPTSTPPPFQTNSHSQQQQQQSTKPNYHTPEWSSQSILTSLLNLFTTRPQPPPRSISHHLLQLATTVANDIHGETPGPDGMYETHTVVMSRAPPPTVETIPVDEGNGSSSPTAKARGPLSSSSSPSPSSSSSSLSLPHFPSHPASIREATSKVVHLSSSLLLLPFRLLTVALKVLNNSKFLLGLGGSTGTGGGGGRNGSYEDAKVAMLEAAFASHLHSLGKSGSGGGGGGDAVVSSSSPVVRTNDVLWISDSPIADLGCAIFLLLVNNYRAAPLASTCGGGGGGTATSSESVSIGLEGGGAAKTTRLDVSKENPSTHSDATTNANDYSCPYYCGNSFRSDLASLDDNRWEGWSTGAGTNSIANMSPTFSNGTATTTTTTPRSETIVSTVPDESVEGQNVPLPPPPIPNPMSTHLFHPTLTDSTHNSILPTPTKLLTANFEHMFESFGTILHNEVGALMLYTLLQSSPIFAASIAVRSDLDTVVVPLLRTLYFSSAVTHHVSGRTATLASRNGGHLPSRNSARSEGDVPTSISSSTTTTLQVLQRPFRSQSQLYLILILLLIFSQDKSFGPDSFRRIHIPSVLWYKERKLKDISLGSLLILSLLRCITFNMNRLQDPFLLSNCCAVLLNLSPHVVDLHSYAAMRLASVTVSSMKRYTIMVRKNGGKAAVEGDVSTVFGMYAEVCRSLLQMVKHSLRSKVISKNLHLVYALVYLQRDFITTVKAKRSPFPSSDVTQILQIITEADEAIRNASARTAEQAMHVLQAFQFHNHSAQTVAPSGQGNITTLESDPGYSATEDFTFTYEEEADPEIFFVPYVWEVTVCAITASSLEWHKKDIQVFPLFEVESDPNVLDLEDANGGETAKQFAKDVSDVV